MSITLKRLRETFDDELVRYERGQVVLTPLGAELKPRVAVIIAQSEELIGTARAFDPREFRGTITLCAPQSTLGFFQAPLAAALAIASPGMTIRGVPYPPRSDLEGRVDVFIVPEWLASPRSPSRRLFVDQFSCLVSADAADAVIDEAAFLARSHAALPPGEEEIFWPDDSPARALLARRDIGARTSGQNALPFLVIRNGLIATMTTRAAQQQCTQSPVCPVDAPAVFTSVVLVVQAAGDRSSEPALRWLMQTMERLAMPFNPANLLGLVTGETR